MVLTTIKELVPYGKFEVKFDERKNLFVVVKNSQIVFKNKSISKAVRMAIKLNKKNKKKRR